MAGLFEERSAGREPSGRFGIDMAEFTRTYVLYDQVLGGFQDGFIPTDLLADRIRKITGTTLPGPVTLPIGQPGGAGSLARVMPMCDPQFCNLFAENPLVRIVASEGYEPAQADPKTVLLAVPPIVPGFSRYQGYEFDVPFTARPYAVLPNSRMVPSVLDFYDVDGARKRLTYYPEWLRFCSLFVEDMDSRISASVGSSMVFRVPSEDGLPLPQPRPLINGSSYSGVPDMVIPDQSYKLRWYGVPLRYLRSSNSYLVRYKGFINQGEFFNQVKGSLLYMGAKVMRQYSPPQFEPTVQPPDAGGLRGILDGSFFAEPLVDLELSFIFTARRRFAGEAAPGDFSLDPDVIGNAERPNNNWIDGPHNWLPHFQSKRFFYAHAKTQPDNDFARWQPSYRSVPQEILFQDPDVPDLIVNL